MAACVNLLFLDLLLKYTMIRIAIEDAETHGLG